MAKRNASAEDFDNNSSQNGNDTSNPGIDTSVDFNLSDEYKPEPLCPGGNYRANITSVSLDMAKSKLVFKVTLEDNGSYLSDGETPLGGLVLPFNVWLPKKGDEKELTSDGRQTKRQSKINMMTRTQDDLGINMNSMAAINQAVIESEWIGLPVIASVGLDEYQGRVRNQISRLVKEQDE